MTREGSRTRPAAARVSSFWRTIESQATAPPIGDPYRIVISYEMYTSGTHPVCNVLPAGGRTESEGPARRACRGRSGVTRFQSAARFRSVLVTPGPDLSPTRNVCISWRIASPFARTSSFLLLFVFFSPLFSRFPVSLPPFFFFDRGTKIIRRSMSSMPPSLPKLP